ncbi:MAG: YjiH family protein, partial [Erysipelotrichaceae bacterium]
MKQHNPEQQRTRSLLNFIFPSLLGIALFMFPIVINEPWNILGVTIEPGITILVAIAANVMRQSLITIIPTLILGLIVLSALGALIVSVAKPKRLLEHHMVRKLFLVSPLWLVIRLLAALFAIMVYTQQGFEFIYSMDTGGLVFYDLLEILFTIFFFAGLFLPLLLNFGLLELVGALLIRVMRPVFNLPGRSAIDCITSWLGDGTIGVLLTSKQYETGFYTKREAAVIGTTFSLVSITFSLVVIQTVNLEHMFLPFYFTVSFASLIAALIVPKLYPLRSKSDRCIDGSKPKNED